MTPAPGGGATSAQEKPPPDIRRGLVGEGVKGKKGEGWGVAVTATVGAVARHGPLRISIGSPDEVAVKAIPSRAVRQAVSSGRASAAGMALADMRRV